MWMNELFSKPQFSFSQQEKEERLLRGLKELTAHHLEHCSEYARLVSFIFPLFRQVVSLTDLPYLPVSLFKTHLLASVPQHERFKILTSSGTTGQAVSRIVLDRDTAQLQSRALASIMTSVLGGQRLPMIIVDTRTLIKDRKQFSARGAGVLGMMSFGRHHFYALDENMNLDWDGLKQFLHRFGDGPFLIFGFTFMVWQYFFQQIKAQGLDLSNGILVHSGGWKKLQDLAVSNEVFKRRFYEQTGLHRIYNFYGMVEQVGSVFLEGEDGYFYAPNFSDVIIRDPVTWEEAPPGEIGVIQVVSVLPKSYPGHSLLTEDLGVVHGIDDGPCGRMGKYFSVIGRVPKAEIRGCSDTHAFAT